LTDPHSPLTNLADRWFCDPRRLRRSDVTEHPDLTGYRLLHRGMRTDASRLRDAVKNITEADRRRRAPVLSRWYGGFLGEFRHHHTVEDDIFFPALARRLAAFEDQVALLADEHRRLEGALVAVEAAVGDLADPHTAFATSHTAAVEALEVASSELFVHLDHEDADVLPLFVNHMSAIEFDEIEERAAKSLPRSQIAFSVPWLLSQTNAAERRHLMKGAPLFLKLVWYLTRGRYARLVNHAFNGATPS
jgi:iron-sulfur cluster repair protein YtfE (RIC family)